MMDGAIMEGKSEQSDQERMFCDALKRTPLLIPIPGPAGK